MGFAVRFPKRLTWRKAAGERGTAAFSGVLTKLPGARVHVPVGKEELGNIHEAVLA